MDKNPLVSIITPTYNSRQYIIEMIKSILNQEYENWELIITDDHSTDNTWDILSYYNEKDKRIKIFRLEKNSGPGVARNNSIEHSKGRFIAFCDSDDYWYPEKLSIQIPFMINNNILVSHTWRNMIDVNGNYLYLKKSPKEIDYSLLIKNDYLPFLTLVYDAHDLGKIYMPNIIKRQDWALKLKLLHYKRKSFCINKPLACYRISPNSVSSNKWKLLKYNFKVYHEIENFNKFLSYILVLRFLLYYILKSLKYFVLQKLGKLYNFINKKNRHKLPIGEK